MTIAPRVGVSLMHHDAFARAIEPLLSAGEIDAFEWSFDAGKRPAWLLALVEHASKEGCLYGHGVHFSPLTAQAHERDAAALDALGEDAARFRFRHVSEHFGFSHAGAVADGAPMPLPFCDGALETGRERLAQMRERVGSAIGLENLALAFGVRDVLDQGALVRALVESGGGFVLLDLHNLWCQSVNFGIDARALLSLWPLDLVRELHVSGGSWSELRGARFRRDTHDSTIPAEVLALLPEALARCPNVEVVVVERLGETLLSREDEAGFAADVRRVREVLLGADARAAAPDVAAAGAPFAVDRVTLAAWQAALVETAARAQTGEELRDALARDSRFAALAPYLASLETRALDVAIALSRRWARMDGGAVSR